MGVCRPLFGPSRPPLLQAALLPSPRGGNTGPLFLRMLSAVRTASATGPPGGVTGKRGACGPPLATAGGPVTEMPRYLLGGPGRPLPLHRTARPWDSPLLWGRLRSERQNDTVETSWLPPEPLPTPSGKRAEPRRRVPLWGAPLLWHPLAPEGPLLRCIWSSGGPPPEGTALSPPSQPVVGDHSPRRCVQGDRGLSGRLCAAGPEREPLRNPGSFTAASAKMLRPEAAVQGPEQA